MALNWLFWDETDMVKALAEEIMDSKNHKEHIDGSVKKFKNKILLSVTSDEVSLLINQMLTEHDKNTVYNQDYEFKLSEGDWRKISQIIHQEVTEELSRAKVEIQNAWGNRFAGIESRIQKLENKPSPSIDLTSIQNAIKQIQTNIQTDNEKINQRFKTLEQAKQTQIPQPPGDNNLKNEIETLKNNFNIQAQNYNNLRLAFDGISRENASIKQQLSQYEQSVARLEKENAAKDQALKNLEALFEKKIESLHGEIEELKKKIGAPPKPIPWIKSFDIPRAQSPKAFFSGDADNVKTKLSQSIQDADNLLLYLNQSQIEDPARTSFIKNMRWCKEALEKFRDKYDFEDCDDDELSEEITTKFFKIISENILDNIMIAIYRGGENAAGYKDFLKKLNDYLSKYGIYTKYIEPKSKLEGDTLSSIEPPISKRTSIAADDGKIDEVELLPYFMDYEDDDGNLDAKRKRGRVVTLKYGA